MAIVKSSTKQDLRADLLRKGITLRSFSRSHNYPYPAVMSAVNRYWGNEKKPCGILTQEILTKLEKVVAAEVTNGN